jgi:hypothetical protein
MRSPNAFTARQIRFLEAIHNRIKEINNPDPEVITNESYEFHTEQTKQFGKIPKLRFRPRSAQIKAEIIVSPGLIDESQKEKKAEIRAKFGIREARNAKANLFESEWNNIMLKAKKAAFTVGLINQLLATDLQAVSTPMAQLQSIVMEEYATQIKVKRKAVHRMKYEGEQQKPKIKGYYEELDDVD